MSPERLLALVLAHSPDFGGVIGGGRPTWTMVEAAWGCAGLSDTRTAAFWWRYGRDQRSLATLRPSLLYEAWQTSQREQWPSLIEGVPYLADLVEVVLTEEHMSELQRDRLLRGLKREWGEQTWDAYLSRKHRTVGAILDRWNVDAHEHIARRIKEYADEA